MIKILEIKACKGCAMKDSNRKKCKINGVSIVNVYEIAEDCPLFDKTAYIEKFTPKNDITSKEARILSLLTSGKRLNTLYKVLNIAEITFKAKIKKINDKLRKIQNT